MQVMNKYKFMGYFCKELGERSLKCTLGMVSFFDQTFFQANTYLFVNDKVILISDFAKIGALIVREDSN